MRGAWDVNHWDVNRFRDTPELPLLVLCERPKRRAASAAVEPHDLQLREHVAASRDDAADVDEHVQVFVADVAQVAGFGALGQASDEGRLGVWGFVFRGWGRLPDAHENFLGDAVAAGGGREGETGVRGEGNDDERGRQQWL